MMIGSQYELRINWQKFTPLIVELSRESVKNRGLTIVKFIANYLFPVKGNSGNNFSPTKLYVVLIANY